MEWEGFTLTVRIIEPWFNTKLNAPQNPKAMLAFLKPRIETKGFDLASFGDKEIIDFYNNYIASWGEVYANVDNKIYLKADIRDFCQARYEFVK